VPVCFIWSARSARMNMDTYKMPSTTDTPTQIWPIHTSGFVIQKKTPPMKKNARMNQPDRFGRIR
jgi:hypothetical protein